MSLRLVFFWLIVPGKQRGYVQLYLSLPQITCRPVLCFCRFTLIYSVIKNIYLTFWPLNSRSATATFGFFSPINVLVCLQPFASICAFYSFLFIHSDKCFLICRQNISTAGSGPQQVVPLSTLPGRLLSKPIPQPVSWPDYLLYCGIVKP